MYDDWTPYPYTTTTSGTQPVVGHSEGIRYSGKPQDISDVKEAIMGRSLPKPVDLGLTADKVDALSDWVVDECADLDRRINALSDWANDLDDAVSDVEKDVEALKAHKTKTVHRLGALELDVYYLERRIGIMESDARLKVEKDRREADQRRKRVGAVVACVVVTVLTFALGYGVMALVDWLYR